MRRALFLALIVAPRLGWSQIRVSGRVVSAGTNRPVAGAAISAEWSGLRDANVSTADHDDRVVPSHGYKFTAAMQAGQTCSHPILIDVETEASPQRTWA